MSVVKDSYDTVAGVINLIQELCDSAIDGVETGFLMTEQNAVFYDWLNIAAYIVDTTLNGAINIALIPMLIGPAASQIQVGPRGQVNIIAANFKTNTPLTQHARIPDPLVETIPRAIAWGTLVADILQAGAKDVKLIMSAIQNYGKSTETDEKEEL